MLPWCGVSAVASVVLIRQQLRMIIVVFADVFFFTYVLCYGVFVSFFDCVRTKILSCSHLVGCGGFV